jgi:hypothetical protein
LPAGERCGAELAQRTANVVEFAQKPVSFSALSASRSMTRAAN